MNHIAILRSFAAVTCLLSVCATATYADDTDTSAAPAITRVDTTPVGFGTGEVKGRSYSSAANAGVKTLVYAFRATPYTKWYFERVFDQWEEHKPDTAWPHMDERVLKAGGYTTADDGGYFTLHRMPEGKYYVVQFGSLVETRSFYTSVAYMDAFFTEVPVSVAAGKVTQIDRSDEREVTLQCLTPKPSADCSHVEMTQLYTITF